MTDILLDKGDKQGKLRTEFVTGGGGGGSLIWLIRGHAAEKGMVFGLSVLNRVYNFM